MIDKNEIETMQNAILRYTRFRNEREEEGERMVGPTISDKDFFSKHLLLNTKGMGPVAKAVRNGEEKEMRRTFAQYIRSHLKPELLFQSPYEIPENVYMLPNETEEEAGARILTKELVSCGVSHEFGEEVNWFYNPTANQYAEWTWQLNRHNEWKLLAHLYRKSKEERYAKACADLFQSWVKQAVVPDKAKGYETLSWRTIECGIRMGANWPYVLHTFYQSPYFTDDVIVDWYKSVWEHGKRLYEHHMQGNWLVMEMNGLAHIGILMPEFLESKEWFDYAIMQLQKQLNEQIYPDGFQYELSTGYHDVVINNYQRLIRTARAYKVPIPDSFYERLEAATEINVKLMMPNGKVPDINDGAWKSVKEVLLPKMELFPNNPYFQWIVSDGKVGTAPSYTTVALPYAGMMVMRSSWKPNAVWGFFDAGPFGRAHQHEDKLSFLLSVGENVVVTEAGNYAYDSSEMRKYVLSTRGHNTVLVDGFEQNRRKNYRWQEEDIEKEAGMEYRISPECDYAEGVYEDGYGEDAKLFVTHKRSVYFIKRTAMIEEPFFLVIDRLYSKKEHAYELLWHIDSEEITENRVGVTTPQLSIYKSENACASELIYGEKTPNWQGWVATASIQGAYRPVYTWKQIVKGWNTRVVNLFYPKAHKQNPIKTIIAGTDTGQSDVTIVLKDGYKLELYEEGLKGRE